MAKSSRTTREALLAAAIDLFARHGFDAVGTREIAARAGANLGAIQYHFGSKSELYVAAVARAMQERASAGAWRILEEPAGDPPAAAARLARFVRTFLRDTLERAELDPCGRLVVLEAVRRSPGAVELIAQHFVRPHTEQLERALAAVAPDLDARRVELAAQSLIGQILHYLVFRPYLALEHGLRAGGAIPYEEIAEHVVRFTLRGLGCGADVRTRARAALHEPETVE